jgi:hypothetical protein
MANTYVVDELASCGEVWKPGGSVTAWFHAIAGYLDSVKRGVE